ncbi:hypothetical protein [Streptomyces carpaticus]|uniref:Uncharacterized protein n=1 Tax=Streptomyces carpaticus TaxID=285558 RepID=A0ABV4ZN25_9ACTN
MARKMKVYAYSRTEPHEAHGCVHRAEVTTEATTGTLTYAWCEKVKNVPLFPVTREPVTKVANGDPLYGSPTTVDEGGKRAYFLSRTKLIGVAEKSVQVVSEHGRHSGTFWSAAHGQLFAGWAASHRIDVYTLDDGQMKYNRDYVFAGEGWPGGVASLVVVDITGKTPRRQLFALSSHTTGENKRRLYINDLSTIGTQSVPTYVDLPPEIRDVTADVTSRFVVVSGGPHLIRFDLEYNGKQKPLKGDSGQVWSRPVFIDLGDKRYCCWVQESGGKWSLETRDIQSPATAPYSIPFTELKFGLYAPYIIELHVDKAYQHVWAFLSTKISQGAHCALAHAHCAFRFDVAGKTCQGGYLDMQFRDGDWYGGPRIVAPVSWSGS